MVEVMKIILTSFKRSHAHTAALSAPSPAAGHHQPTPLLETPGYSLASLGQSLVGSLLLSPGSWCTQGFVCDLQKEVGQRLTVLPREGTGHSKQPLPTTQKKTLHTDNTRWSILKNQTDYVLCSQRWSSSIQSAKTRPGAVCCSDHECLIAKF